MNRSGDSESTHDPGLLAAYVEDRLDGAERSEFTLHLAACAECRQALAMMARAPGLRPAAVPARTISPPVWLAIAAAVILATVAVRRAGGPAPVDVAARPPAQDVSPIAAPSAPAVVEAPPAAIPTGGPRLDPGLLVKRGGGPRTIGGRSFRLREGEWVDTAFDSAASLPVVRVVGSAERAAIVEKVPALAPYLALGERVVVVVDGTAYRFSP